MCDDRNLSPGDGCAFDCRSDETCGNGTPDFIIGETCDDGAQLDHDTCDDVCAIGSPTWLARYGDGVGVGGIVYHSALGYDAGRGELLTFGGSTFSFGSPSLTLATTRSIGPTRAWRSVATTTSPPARTGAAMTYDAARGELLMFGGAASGMNLDDTWRWNGSTWRAEAGGPAGRSFALLTYDPVREQAEMLGGTTVGAPIDDDTTWIWDGSEWIGQVGTPFPTSGLVGAMAYDPRAGRVTLVRSHEGLGETWTWDGSEWTALAVDSLRVEIVVVAAAG